MANACGRYLDTFSNQFFAQASHSVFFPAPALNRNVPGMNRHPSFKKPCDCLPEKTQIQRHNFDRDLDEVEEIEDLLIR